MVEVRIAIREQLGCLVFLATSISLAVIALATWYTNHKFVLDVRLVSCDCFLAREQHTNVGAQVCSPHVDCVAQVCTIVIDSPSHASPCQASQHASSATDGLGVILQRGSKHG
jgi:hypothetical protein